MIMYFESWDNTPHIVLTCLDRLTSSYEPCLGYLVHPAPVSSSISLYVNTRLTFTGSKGQSPPHCFLFDCFYLMWKVFEFLKCHYLEMSFSWERRRKWSSNEWHFDKDEMSLKMYKDTGNNKSSERIIRIVAYGGNILYWLKVISGAIWCHKCIFSDCYDGTPLFLSLKKKASPSWNCTVLEMPSPHKLPPQSVCKHPSVYHVPFRNVCFKSDRQRGLTAVIISLVFTAREEHN